MAPSDTQRQARLERVAEKAGDYEEVAISCAQGTLVALTEEFGLPGGDDMVKAMSFMPGMASRDETCGALVAGLAILGLVMGRGKLSDPEYNTPQGKAAFFKSRELAYRFCEEFKQQMGSTMCGDIRKKLFGRTYNTFIPAEFEQLVADGAQKKCRVPPETAARIAAAIILESAGAHSND
jgi:C_GCAxxG_C_C family probable redox protein